MSLGVVASTDFGYFYEAIGRRNAKVKLSPLIGDPSLSLPDPSRDHGELP
jgi:hypothetical protein